MKTIVRISSVVIVMLFFQFILFSQESHVNEAYKNEAIQTLSTLMNDHYVFPDVAKSTEEHLKKQWEEGHFDEIDNDEDFAEALTSSVQSINKDKHMRIMVNPHYVAPENSPERKVEELIDRRKRSRNSNLGFTAVELKEGNVGYLDLRGFAGLENGKVLADAAMKLMDNADAVIVDLRNNGGGSPEMVQYLCSFFFDEHLHLNSLYFRDGDITEEYWTLDEVGGTKMPDVPLFVMTSDQTFSGAEEFSYNMQTQKRATLIGQTTRGGANPGGTIGINKNLRVFIPGGMAINPITNTNWEGVGVVPEIACSVEETMDKTYALAKEAAEKFRQETDEKHKKMFMDLSNVLDNYQEGTSDQAIYEGLQKCLDEKLLREWNINSLGYEYLIEHKKPKVAESIFKANTLLHPNSPNVFDSYGEILMEKGDLEASLENYKKAVAIAKKNEDRDLKFYIENMAKVEKKMAEKREE